jgi:hypothetical protein
VATIKELRNAIRISQQVVAQRARINRARLSGAETGYLTLEPAEERVVREVIADLARERYADFLGRLREAE